MELSIQEQACCSMAVSVAKGSTCLLFPPLEEDEAAPGAAPGRVLSIKRSLDMFWSSVTRFNSSLNGCCQAARRWWVSWMVGGSFLRGGNG